MINLPHLQYFLVSVLLTTWLQVCMKVGHGNISQTKQVKNYVFSFICKNSSLTLLSKISVSLIDVLRHSRNILCFPFTSFTF